MPLTLEQAREHKQAFDKKYFYPRPHGYYTMSTDLLTLGECIEKLERKGVRDLPKTDGLSLDDYCLVVTLREKPPKEVNYPLSFGTLRIFYQIEKGIGF